LLQWARQRHDIETDRPIFVTGIMLDEMLRCPAYFATFACIDRFGRMHEPPVTAVTNLDNDQANVILHDEVQFPESASVIRRQQAEPPAFEVLQR
jgi:hypothetical protein